MNHNGKTNNPRRRGGKRYTAETQAKSFTLPFDVLLAFRSLAVEYGSQGRAIQVGAEILFRLSQPLSVPRSDPMTNIRWTYKLPPRTIGIIERLARHVYKNEGTVLAACAQILRMDKVPVCNPRRRKDSTLRKERQASVDQHSAHEDDLGNGNRP